MTDTYPTLEGTQERIRYNAGFREKRPDDEEAVVEEMIFPGYASEYRYTCVHDAEKTVCVYSKEFDEKGKPVNPIVSPPRYSHRSNVFLWVRVAETPRINEKAPLDPDYVLCAPRISGEKHSMPVPMQIIHADVLPSILPDDDIYVQTSLIVDTISFRPDRENDDLPTTLHMTDGTFMAYTSLVNEKDVPKRRREQVFLHARIHQAFFIRKKWNDGVRTVTLILKTAYGIIDAIVREDKLTEDQLKRCRRGNLVDIVGWLSVDPAIEEYQQGAIWDEQHLRRLFEDCCRTGRFWRLTKALSPKCYLETDGYSSRVKHDEIITVLYQENSNKDKTASVRYALEIKGNRIHKISVSVKHQCN